MWEGPTLYVQSSHPIGPHGQGYLLIDYGEAGGDTNFNRQPQFLRLLLGSGVISSGCTDLILTCQRASVTHSEGYG